MVYTYYMLSLVAVAMVFDVAIVVHYSLVDKWWKGPLGRTLVTMSLCLALIYAWTLAIYLWPHVPGRDVVRASIFTTLATVTVWRYIALARFLRDLQELKKLRADHDEKEGDK